MRLGGVIDLSDSLASGFGGLTISQTADGALVDLGTGSSILVADRDAADLDASDFLF